jgi:hypothetical protein
LSKIKDILQRVLAKARRLEYSSHFLTAHILANKEIKRGIKAKRIVMHIIHYF